VAYYVKTMTDRTTEQSGLLPDDGGGEHHHLGTVSSFVLFIICMSSVGGLMFGYDTGVISGVLVLLGDDLGSMLSEFQLEIITSVTAAFALVGSLVAGIASDSIGRKPVIGSACVVFIVAAIVMSAAESYLMLVTGRAIVGVAVGAASTTVPVYIAEVSPPNHRGKLVTLNSVSCTGGQVLAYLSGAAFQFVPHGWRYMLAISAIPPFLFLMAMTFIPESPRYLVLRGRSGDAIHVLRKLFPTADVAYIETMIERQVHSNEDFNKPYAISDFSKLFTVPSNFRALVVAGGLMASQQLCGFNSFMYYSATMFKTIGFDNPIAVSIVVSLTNFAFTWVAVLYVDVVGRRKMLLRTIWIMIVALVVTGFGFEIDPSKQTSQKAYLVVLSTIVYVASYSSALGNVPWQAIEFLPLDVRALGSMMISSTNWVCNSVVSLTFLSLLRWITPSGTFVLYACFTLLAYVGIYYCYPEVAGMPLEDINQIFSEGFILKR
jgi:SP family myo-inositol transporter-like MFS transporter 13